MPSTGAPSAFLRTALAAFASSIRISGSSRRIRSIRPGLGHVRDSRLCRRRANASARADSVRSYVERRSSPYAERMEPAPNRRLLRQLAWKQGQVLIAEPDADDSWALVTPDNAGKGTDPDGKKAAEYVFANGLGAPLQDIADLLSGRGD